RRQDDMRPIPAKDRGGRRERREREQRGADRRDRPPAEEGGTAADHEHRGAHERTREHDGMTARVQLNLLAHGLHASPPGDKPLAMHSTARRAAVATLVVISIVVVALALWKIRVLIALLLLG